MDSPYKINFKKLGSDAPELEMIRQGALLYWAFIWRVSLYGSLILFLPFIAPLFYLFICFHMGIIDSVDYANNMVYWSNLPTRIPLSSYSTYFTYHFYVVCCLNAIIYFLLGGVVLRRIGFLNTYKTFKTTRLCDPAPTPFSRQILKPIFGFFMAESLLNIVNWMGWSVTLILGFAIFYLFIRQGWFHFTFTLDVEKEKQPTPMENTH